MQSTTAGVILAAGSSTRMGTTKQLLEFKGKTFIENVIETAIGAGLSPIIVVLGADGEEIIPHIGKYGKEITIIYNRNWKEGQSSTLRIAIPEIMISKSSIFLLSDQPQIEIELIKALRERFDTTHSKIIASYVGENRTNPVLFSSELYSELANVQGDQGGRVLFKKYAIEKLVWPDERIMIDVDTEEDYKRLREAYGIK
jgi:molybdenum cofactor cytidylyltransferase